MSDEPFNESQLNGTRFALGLNRDFKPEVVRSLLATISARDERIRQLEAVVEVVREYDEAPETEVEEDHARADFVRRIHAALLGSPQEPPT